MCGVCVCVVCVCACAHVRSFASVEMVDGERSCEAWFTTPVQLQLQLLPLLFKVTFTHTVLTRTPTRSTHTHI